MDSENANQTQFRKITALGQFTEISQIFKQKKKPVFQFWANQGPESSHQPSEKLFKEKSLIIDQIFQVNS